MTSSAKQPPKRGEAWRGDWRQRVHALLADRGFTSVETFAATSPSASFVDLANGLGQAAAVQLEWIYLDEAKLRGRVEYCARDFLVRQLHANLGDGWSTSGGDEAAVWPRVNAISAWASSISSHLPEYDSIVSTLSRTILKQNPFPVGWLPASADDPVLVEFFAKHWREPDGER